jgi:glutamyl-tRNA synthetase
MILMTDFDKLTPYFFNDINLEKDMVKFTKSEWQDTIKGLEKTIESLEMIEKSQWDSVEDLNLFLSQVVSVNGLKNGDVFWPVRVALSAESASPSPAELLWTLGIEESLKRLKNALVLIKK